MQIEQYIERYFEETAKITESVDREEIKKAVLLLSALKKNGGRLFILGVGGSAANASHAVNDFRKIGGIETYAPTDNAAELTARTNDEGWNTVFYKYLETSKLRQNDAIMIFSVGGGSQNASLNLKEACDYAKKCGAKILGIVSRDGGYTKQKADVCILIPVFSQDTITPHAEGWQGIIWHLIVNALP
ncbi:MAG: SIS domain-containing protein [Elusimicrobiota bacterium]|jgi:D-sedoheptulose 7-phosphate isomerase|nr:SIS domain-containing protein [Elusimicrobiota bacterium]